MAIVIARARARCLPSELSGERLQNRGMPRRRASRATSPSSWTATAAGPRAATVRAASAIAKARSRARGDRVLPAPRRRGADAVRVLQRKLEAPAERSRRADAAVPQGARSRSRRAARERRAHRFVGDLGAFATAARAHAGRDGTTAGNASCSSMSPSTTADAGTSPRPRAAPRLKSPRDACAPRTSTSTRWRRSSAWPICRRSISSSAPAASSASAISCSGRSPMPSSISPMRCGPTSTSVPAPRIDDFARRERRYGLTCEQVATAS